VGDEENEDDDVSRDKVPLLQSDSTAGLCGRLSREIESLLSRLMEVNNRMSAVADNSRSSSTTYTLQRHRDILNDYAKEFRKTKSNFEMSMDREKLFQTSSKNGDTVIPISNSQSTSMLSREAESARK
jgi:Golgi SNAP receptor complex protein 1